jgi:hypothetical protein
MLTAVLLVAGCSETVGGTAQPVKTNAPPTATTVNALTAPPAPGAPIGDVVAWIAAGAPADEAGYHTANRDGTETNLGDDVALSTPSGKTKCATVSGYSNALMCLVDLKNPPPRPADFPTHWQDNWVDFDGRSVTVGSPHGDPGPFANGYGPPLPYGQTLKTVGYQCRSDELGLYCTDTAQQSAVKLSDAGVEPFGCLKSVPAPPDIGLKFSC